MDKMENEPFRILDHTADVGFEVSGQTLDEVFANAGRALVHIFVDLDAIEPRKEIRIETTGEDTESLLVNWLSEILLLIDADGWLFSEFKVSLKDSQSLSARARGTNPRCWSRRLPTTSWKSPGNVKHLEGPGIRRYLTTALGNYIRGGAYIAFSAMCATRSI